MGDYVIRPLQLNDIPKLIDMRPGFRTNRILRVETTGTSYEMGWQLVEVELDKPYDKGHGYDFDATERENIRERLGQNNTLLEVALEPETERIIGILDIEERTWNNTVWIWNIMLDETVRGQGLGTHLMERTIAWARHRKVRAIMLETQTNNIPACRFYAKMGFELVGINTLFYSNRDIERDEIAIFWGYPLK
jgi:streptothricin acetyltransferase